MSKDIKLKDDYTLSNCCSPGLDEDICGYYSHDNIIKVHSADCANLKNVETERILKLNWDEIVVEKTKFEPDAIFYQLERDDFRILKHHLDYGIDYSLLIASKLNIAKEDAFERHKKLREMDLIERVEAKIVQYRKGIVDNKWIKHRNHTYYQLTNKGENFIKYYLERK